LLQLSKSQRRRARQLVIGPRILTEILESKPNPIRQRLFPRKKRALLSPEKSFFPDLSSFTTGGCFERQDKPLFLASASLSWKDSS